MSFDFAAAIAVQAINPAATQVLPPLDLGPPGGGTP